MKLKAQSGRKEKEKSEHDGKCTWNEMPQKKRTFARDHKFILRNEWTEGKKFLKEIIYEFIVIR